MTALSILVELSDFLCVENVFFFWGGMKKYFLPIPFRGRNVKDIIF